MRWLQRDGLIANVTLLDPRGVSEAAATSTPTGCDPPSSESVAPPRPAAVVLMRLHVRTSSEKTRRSRLFGAVNSVPGGVSLCGCHLLGEGLLGAVVAGSFEALTVELVEVDAVGGCAGHCSPRPLSDITGSAYGDGLVKLGCGDRGARGAPITCPVSEVLWPKAGACRDHWRSAVVAVRRFRACRFLGDNRRDPEVRMPGLALDDR